MQTAHCLYELGSIEASTSLTKLLILPQVKEKLAAIEEIHDEVEFGRRLERIV